MECIITVSIVEESVVGNIGDDWEYVVTASVLDGAGAPVATGRMPVAEHILKPGTPQPPPQATGVKIPAGACGNVAKVELAIEVNEVDWLVDDPASRTVVIPVECPGPGNPPITRDAVVSITVREQPAVLRGQATFKLKARMVAVCAGD